MTWAWTITLQWNTPCGLTAATAGGTLSPGQAARLGTRAAAYAAILVAGRQAMKVPDGSSVAVLFRSLEPDDLTARGGAA